VARTVAVLDFLASRPREAFSLSDLARHLELNKATAHATLAALVDAGYLGRRPNKTYLLGPAAVALGRAALARHPALEVARPEIETLAAELDLEVIASVADGEEIVVLAVAGTPQPLTPSVQVGQRLPLVPPLGTVFMAWAPPAEVDAWLGRVGPSATAAERGRYRQALAVARERGCTVALDAEARRRLATELAGRGDRDAVRAVVEELGHEDYLLVEVEHAQPYRVNHVGAPVFGPDGSVVLALTVIGFRDDLTVADVPAVADRLLTVAGRVTDAIGGHPPSEAAA
jgi:DNA-binding IclR family transcriptional regulator